VQKQTEKALLFKFRLLLVKMQRKMVNDLKITPPLYVFFVYLQANKRIICFQLNCIAMGSEKKHHHRKHIDDSEIWKHKTLASAENRKKFARWTTVLMCVVAGLIVAACVLAYFFDR